MLTTTAKTTCPTSPSHPAPSQQACPVPSLLVALNLSNKRQQGEWAEWLMREVMQGKQREHQLIPQLHAPLRASMLDPRLVSHKLSHDNNLQTITNTPRNHKIHCPISRFIFRKFHKKPTEYISGLPTRTVRMLSPVSMIHQVVSLIHLSTAVLFHLLPN